MIARYHLHEVTTVTTWQYFFRIYGNSMNYPLSSSYLFYYTLLSEFSAAIKNPSQLHHPPSYDHRSRRTLEIFLITSITPIPPDYLVENQKKVNSNTRALLTIRVRVLSFPAFPACSSQQCGNCREQIFFTNFLIVTSSRIPIFYIYARCEPIFNIPTYNYTTRNQIKQLDSPQIKSLFINKN